MEHSETFWMFKNILKSSNGTFWNVPQQIFSWTLWVVLKHFSLNNLKCLQTCSGTFWMFRNFLKSSNGTFWVCKYFIMFTNSFGNFLNVQEHFKKLLWNILKYFPTNFLMNIFNSSQNFFQKISEFVLKYFFTRHFDLKCLQTCSETFWMFKNILKSSNGTF